MRETDPRKLSVLIGGDSLVARRSGVGRMTVEITRAARTAAGIERTTLVIGEMLRNSKLIDTLDEFDPELVPIQWRVMIGRVPGVQALRRLKNGTLDRNVKQLAREAGGRLVYHEPNMIVRPLNLPTVVTMNDLSWHHERSWHPVERLHWIDRNLKTTLKQARRFAAISQFTKESVIRELGVPADRIDVIPLAPAREFRPMGAVEAAPILKRLALQDQSFVFSISTIEPRKNFDRLLAAHLRLPKTVRARVPLVIAGGRGWGEVLTHPEADAAIRDGSIRLLGHVADGDLVALCARSTVFAYVSLYEGFGLPVVEAMATGCPVLASSTTAIGEIARGAALLVDPMDVDSIGHGLLTVIEDRSLANRLATAGLARSGEYSWQRTIAALTACWRRALDQ